MKLSYNSYTNNSYLYFTYKYNKSKLNFDKFKNNTDGNTAILVTCF